MPLNMLVTLLQPFLQLFHPPLLFAHQFCPSQQYGQAEHPIHTRQPLKQARLRRNGWVQLLGRCVNHLAARSGFILPAWSGGV